MNIKITSLCTLLLVAAFTGLQADEPAKKANSPEFERMKSLVGTWSGKTDIGHGPVDMTIQYRLIAGGSVLEERIAPGTDHEMLSMYYDKAGKLAMTHYCVLGNRPEMALKASDAKSLTFDLDASCCAFDPKKESHMHGMVLNFDDKDTITTHCSAIIDGKSSPANASTFKRISSTTTAAK
jgi:hypothetical protein